MVVSHNNLLTLIGQDSVASSRGSTVRQVLSTFSRSLPVVVVSTLGRSTSSAAITQITLSTRRCITLSHSLGLPLAERALASFDGRSSDSFFLQGFHSIEHASSGSRRFKAWAWVALGWGSSIAISLAADALWWANAIRGYRRVANGSTLWWSNRAQRLFERWEALRGFRSAAVSFSELMSGGAMLRDATFGLRSRSWVGPCDSGFIRICRVRNRTQFGLDRSDSFLVDRSMAIGRTLGVICILPAMFTVANTSVRTAIATSTPAMATSTGNLRTWFTLVNRGGGSDGCPTSVLTLL